MNDKTLYDRNWYCYSPSYIHHCKCLSYQQIQTKLLEAILPLTYRNFLNLSTWIIYSICTQCTPNPSKLQRTPHFTQPTWIQFSFGRIVNRIILKHLMVYKKNQKIRKQKNSNRYFIFFYSTCYCSFRVFSPFGR